MTKLGLLSSVFLSLSLAGCITDKEVGLETESGEESESAGSSDGSTTDVAPTTGASASGTGSSSSAETTDTLGETSSTGSSGSDTESDSDSETDSAGESSSGSTTGDIKEPDDQELCEMSGGTWDPTSCGHYFCGLQPDCGAVDPGCDCGEDSNFIDGTGCVESVACDPFEFSCGPELSCDAPDEYCDVFIPGVKKAETTYNCAATPPECTIDYTCDCLEFDMLEGDCSEGADGSLRVTFAGA